MKRVTYAGTSFITGSEIADALLRLVAALGLSGQTASVHIPAHDDDAGRVSVDIVIGPTSEVLAVEIDNVGPELIDEEVVDLLTEQTRLLARPHAEPAEDDRPRGWSDQDATE